MLRTVQAFAPLALTVVIGALLGGAVNWAVSSDSVEAARLLQQGLAIGGLFAAFGYWLFRRQPTLT